MENAHTHAPLLRLVGETKALAQEPVMLLDIGCSGGLHEAFRLFGDTLEAHGFDPSLDEIERLQAAESNPRVHYHPAYVGLPPDHPLAVARRANAQSMEWARRFAVQAWFERPDRDDLLLMQAPRRLAPADAIVGIDGFVAARGLPRVDFLKIDVDGGDAEALASAAETLSSGQVLAVAVEVTFPGAAGAPHGFAFFDQFLKERGFDLFDLSIRRYARASLPTRFELNGICQSRYGQVVQGDALYCRDLAAAGPTADHSPPRLLKLACFFDMFGLRDAAAEILLVHRERLSALVDVEAALDLLPPLLQGRRLSHRAYCEAVNADPTLLFPRNQPEEPDWKAMYHALRAEIAQGGKTPS